MTVNDPRPELAAMPAASRPKPPPARGGGRVGGRFRASGSGGRSPAKVRQRREALPQPPPSGRGAQRNASGHARIRGMARTPEAPRGARKAGGRSGPRMTKHDISGGPLGKNMTIHDIPAGVPAARAPNRRPGPLHAAPLPVMPLHVMPGLVPGIHFRRRNGPDGDARNKSGHDGGGKRKRRANHRPREGGDDKNMTIHDIHAGVHAPTVAPASELGSDHGSRRHRSRWRTISAAGACPPRLRGDRLPRSGAAARTGAGPRLPRSGAGTGRGPGRRLGAGIATSPKTEA